jgi:uncharacterized protein (DUF433 family)
VSVLLNNLAKSESYESIMQGYRVTREDIQAAFQFAASLTREQ